MIWVLGMAALPTASHADLSTVGYVHQTILDAKGVTVPVPNGVNPAAPNSVRYLMAQIDAANAINGTVTNYAADATSTSNVMTPARVAADVVSLVVDAPGGEFSVTLTNMTAGSAFSFAMSASGNFRVDWGDDTTPDVITRTNTTNATYSHTYATAGNYTVTISGKATGYNASTNTAAISFINSSNKTKLTAISGGLGSIFSTLSNGENPRFPSTFSFCTGLSGPIPSDLFTGITGAPVEHMFNGTFNGCAGLTSIPSDLFAGITGAPATNMFSNTFRGCTGLVSIPSGLFAGVSGAPATSMFSNTFYGCTGLTSIPSDLFAGISGAPAEYMFSETFYGCTGLTSLPSGLFAGITGAPANAMFSWAFYGCTGLTSLPSGLFAGITGAPATYMFQRTFSNTGLTSVPSGLFAGINGAPADGMFNSTFDTCRGLTTIPSGLFGTYTGAPTSNMFSYTFSNCTGLTTIEEGIWDLSGVTNSNGASMFLNTFYGCTNITSPSPTIAPASTVKLWDHFTAYTGQMAFRSCTKMSDYATIPAVWK